MNGTWRDHPWSEPGETTLDPEALGAVLRMVTPGDIVTFHGGVAIRLGARLSNAMKLSWPPWWMLASHVGVVGHTSDRPLLFESTTLNTEADAFTGKVHRGVAATDLERRVVEAVGRGQRVFWRPQRSLLPPEHAAELFYRFDETKDQRYEDFDLEGIYRLIDAELFDYFDFTMPRWVRRLLRLGPNGGLPGGFCSRYAAYLLRDLTIHNTRKKNSQHSPTDWFLMYPSAYCKPVEVIP